MARPKLGDGEPERLHVKITTDELAAIDEWRFENRIASRSEAVRRLCQIGLFVDQELERAVDVASGEVHRLSDQSKKLYEAYRLVMNWNTVDMTFTRDQLYDIFSLAFDQADASYEGVLGLHNNLVSIFNAIVGMVEAKSLRAGQSKARAVIDEANAAFEEAEAKKADRDAESAENRYLGLVFISETHSEREEYEQLPDDEKEQYLERRVAALREEEAADPVAFAKRLGIDHRKFWERPEWQQLIKGLVSDSGGKS